MAHIIKRNAYGYRWHVMIDGRGIVYSGHTMRSCLDYCKRHGITATRYR
jgi:hypothetical protein